MAMGSFHRGFCLAAAVWMAAGAGLAQQPEPILLIRMPEETPAPFVPSEGEISRFFAERGNLLDMSRQDVDRDPEQARRILGQSEIFRELEIFSQELGIPAKVRFVDWGDAFRFFSDYVSDPTNRPVAVQIGDTWVAHFDSLGAVPHRRRFTWDVRMLWYWKDLVDPKLLADGEGFLTACENLRASAPEGMTAPFAIGTALSWNLLHDLSIWLYNAGVPQLISTDRKFGLLPWKEATFGEQGGPSAAQYLIQLANRGCVALPDRTAEQVSQDFLSRRYAMAVLGAWVSNRAETALGPRWKDLIGATLPPRIGASAATTMKGGSYVAVLDPGRGAQPKAAAHARALVDFLAGAESQRRYTAALGDLPANPQALSEARYIDLFQSALQRGKTYPEIAEWAPVVENLTTRDNLYAFWKRLAALTDSTFSSRADREAREKLILAALQSAQTDINRELTPGTLNLLWPWMLGLFVIAFGAVTVSLAQRQAEKKRAHARLMASERKYRDLYDNAPDMFCSVDTASGKIVQCNRMLTLKTGYARGEIIGRHIFDMYHSDCLEDVKRAAEALYQSGELSDVELQLKCKDGGKLDVSLNVSAIRDEQGQIIRTRSVWRDITEKKKAQEEFNLQRQQLAHVSRAATLGELTASLAHELNQPLAAIVSNAQAGERILKSPQPDLAEVKDVLQDIASDGKRASEVIRRLRALLTKGNVERVNFDVNQVIQEVVQLVRPDAVLQGLQIRLELTPALPPVSGDRVQLQQVLLNLIINAAEAMNHTETECRQLTVASGQPEPSLLQISVQDCGVGIDGKSIGQIFDAFYSTKPQGLGMGLSISRSIVEAHGGRLWVTPNPGPGVTFHFTLPASVVSRQRQNLKSPAPLGASG